MTANYVFFPVFILRKFDFQPHNLIAFVACLFSLFIEQPSSDKAFPISPVLVNACVNEVTSNCSSLCYFVTGFIFNHFQLSEEPQIGSLF